MATSKVNKVIDSGTSNGWNWRKFEDGTAECWQRITKSITGVSKSAIPWSGYEYDFGTLTYPSNFFVAAPVISVSGEVDSNYCVVSYQKSYAANAAISLTSNTSGAHSCIITVHAIGRWK